MIGARIILVGTFCVAHGGYWSESEEDPSSADADATIGRKTESTRIHRRRLGGYFGKSYGAVCAVTTTLATTEVTTTWDLSLDYTNTSTTATTTITLTNESFENTTTVTTQTTTTCIDTYPEECGNVMKGLEIVLLKDAELLANEGIQSMTKKVIITVISVSLSGMLLGCFIQRLREPPCNCCQKEVSPKKCPIRFVRKMHQHTPDTFKSPECLALEVLFLAMGVTALLVWLLYNDIMETIQLVDANLIGQAVVGLGEGVVRHLEEIYKNVLFGTVRFPVQFTNPMDSHAQITKIEAKLFEEALTVSSVGPVDIPPLGTECVPMRVYITSLFGMLFIGKTYFSFQSGEASYVAPAVIEFEGTWGGDDIFLTTRAEIPFHRDLLFPGCNQQGYVDSACLSDFFDGIHENDILRSMVKGVHTRQQEKGTSVVIYDSIVFDGPLSRSVKSIVVFLNVILCLFCSFCGCCCWRIFRCCRPARLGKEANKKERAVPAQMMFGMQTAPQTAVQKQPHGLQPYGLPPPRPDSNQLGAASAVPTRTASPATPGGAFQNGPQRRWSLPRSFGFAQGNQPPMPQFGGPLPAGIAPGLAPHGLPSSGGVPPAQNPYGLPSSGLGSNSTALTPHGAYLWPASPPTSGGQATCLGAPERHASPAMPHWGNARLAEKE